MNDDDEIKEMRTLFKKTLEAQLSQAEEANAEAQKNRERNIQPCGCPEYDNKPRYRLELFLTAEQIMKIMELLK